MLIDSHCHIDFEEYTGRIPHILKEMTRNQVTHALCVCVNLADFPRVLALADGHTQFFASVGVHPDQIEDASPKVHDLVERAQHQKVVAIGETGLIIAERRSGVATSAFSHAYPRRARVR